MSNRFAPCSGVADGGGAHPEGPRQIGDRMLELTNGNIAEQAPCLNPEYLPSFGHDVVPVHMVEGSDTIGNE